MKAVPRHTALALIQIDWDVRTDVWRKKKSARLEMCAGVMVLSGGSEGDGVGVGVAVVIETPRPRVKSS